MKKYILLIVILFSIVGKAYSQCTPVDIILNPGFEELFERGNDPRFWQPNDSARISDQDPYEGNYCAYFSEGTYTQEIDFLPCTDYILSMWVNASAGKSVIATLTVPGSLFSFASVNSGETNGWEQISMPFSIGQDYLGIRLELYGGSRSSDEVQSVDLLELCIVNPTTNANIIQVPQDYGSIQEAVDAANDDDVVLIAPGTYNITETIIVDKPILVTSEYINSGEESDIDATIITGPTNLDPLILFTETASNAACAGITFQGARKQLTLECDFMKVTYCKFFDNGSDALSIEAGGGYFAYNYFENNGDEAIDADDSLDWLAEYNTIINPGDDGFEIRLHNNDRSSRTHIIRHNYISGADEDGIQLIDYDGDSGREFQIYNNIIRNSAMVGLGCTSNGNTIEDFVGSYMEEEALVYNNVFDNNNYGITGASNMLLLNNIIINNQTVGIKRIENNSFADYNCLFNNTADFDNVVADPNNIFVDPLLKSDYSLESDSPCIDAGDAYVNKNGLILSIECYLGDTIDIGAKEFGADVSDTNVAPIVSAGSNEVILEPINSITLSGEYTDDGLPEGNTPTILWTVESAPEGGNVNFNSQNELSTTASFDKQGSYELRLLIDDGDKSSSDVITVYYANDYNDTTIELTDSIFIEAEDYQYIVGGAAVIADNSASQEEIVNATLGGGFAYTEYELVSFASGVYYIWVNASGPNSDSNQINVSFNDLSEEFSAETTTTNTFGDDSWIKFTFTDIPEGVYPLRIYAGEERVSWDRIFVTMNENENPVNVLSINESHLNSEGFSLYPIPNNGNFNIFLNNNVQNNISIFNLQGQKVFVTTVEGKVLTPVDAVTLGNGVYFVLVNNMSGNTIKKIVIDKKNSK